MKGVVFTEFIEFIENKFGFDICDDMIEQSNTSTKGVFTQAGNYPFSDMFSMIKSLSEITNIPIPDLIQAYGEHLFTMLIKIYPKPVTAYNNSFDFIANVENVVHPEVKKLYPDSDLPTFELISRDSCTLKVKYISTKPLMDFAKGLMIACGKHYGENLEVGYEVLKGGQSYEAEFTITK
ncbi:MAG: heme NO-binding domain-containing protein [Campylobacterota bacterium]